MSTLKFDVEKLTEFKTLCEGKATELSDMKKELVDSLEELRATWQTAAGEAFFLTENQDWGKQIDSYVSITNAIAELLDKAILEYRDLEDQAKRLDIEGASGRF